MNSLKSLFSIIFKKTIKILPSQKTLASSLFKVSSQASVHTGF